MLNFKGTGVLLGGVDIMKFVTTILQMLIDKGVVTENEITGYLVKAGFKVTQSEAQALASLAPVIERHEDDCLCGKCKLETLQ